MNKTTKAISENEYNDMTFEKFVNDNYTVHSDDGILLFAIVEEKFIPSEEYKIMLIKKRYEQ